MRTAILTSSSEAKPVHTEVMLSAVSPGRKRSTLTEGLQLSGHLPDDRAIIARWIIYNDEYNNAWPLSAQ